MIWTIMVMASAALLTCFLGYWIHRAFHSEWSGPFFKAHLNHHTIQYPPEDFTSDEYRSAGKDNSLIYFALAFLPVIAFIIALCLFLGVSLWTCGCAIATMVVVGLLHDSMHDSFHLNKTKWSYVPLYGTWKELHRTHHEHMGSNYGIFSFTFDRLFKTYKE